MIDAQLPVQLARRLSKLGHDAWHVSDLGLVNAPDSVIWSEAVRRRCAILTKDSDFAIRSDLGLHPAPLVIWICCGNMRNAMLVDLVTGVMPTVEQAVARGDRVIEIVGGSR